MVKNSLAWNVDLYLQIILDRMLIGKINFLKYSGNNFVGMTLKNDEYSWTGEQARCPPQGAFHGDVETPIYTHDCFLC